MYDYGHPLLNYIESLTFSIYDWTLLFGALFLSIEILHDLFTHRFTKKTLRETMNSIVTQLPYYVSETVLFSGVVYLFFVLHQYIPWQLPVNWWVFAGALIAADFVYYVEHRLAHRIRLLWIAHTVHHSAQIMNTSTAFRFSIVDPLISAALYLPLILTGLHPVFIFAGEILIQAYQFWIHTEKIKSLGPLEYVLNTPSHHRVHHSRIPSSRDKNYGGVLIIWDRLFGTFEKEADQTKEYGLPQQVDTWNPVTVQLHELPRLATDMNGTSIRKRIQLLLSPPEWIRTGEGLWDDTKRT